MWWIFSKTALPPQLTCELFNSFIPEFFSFGFFFLHSEGAFEAKPSAFSGLGQLKRVGGGCKTSQGVCCPCLHVPCVPPVQWRPGWGGWGGWGWCLWPCCFLLPHQGEPVSDAWVVVSCLHPDQQQNTATITRAKDAVRAHCRVGWRWDLMLVYSKGERKGSLCGMLAKWTISLSPKNCHFFYFFLFHWLHLHMIFMQSFLKHCAVFENELNSESFSLYYFSPGNCTNPLSISLFPRGWVIYYLDPAGQISKSLTQNEQPSLFLWVMGREFEIMVRVLKNGAKTRKKNKLDFFSLDISYGEL